MKKILIAAFALCLTLPAYARGGHGGGHGGGHSAGRSGGHSVSHAVRAPRASRAGAGTGAKSEREHVNAYTTRNGTYVAGHNRSTRDGTKTNNWSTKGNVNPETGKAGTR